MTEDQLNPLICPSALEEDGTLDRSKWDGAHKFHTIVNFKGEDVQECSECGAIDDTPHITVKLTQGTHFFLLSLLEYYEQTSSGQELENARAVN